MNKNVLILPIEVKVREFFPKLLLACNIVKKSNFNVFFGGQRFLTKKLSPKNCIFFDKFTYSKSRPKAPYHRNNKIVMQDEEGPISYMHDETVKKRYTLDQKKYVDYFLFSGPKDLKKISYLNISKKRRKIFGLPKIELLKKKNLHYFKNEVDQINKIYKDFLFVPGHSSVYRSDKQSDFFFDGKNKKKGIDNYININKNYYSLINLCKKIALENPELTIIFRRHPNESDEHIKKILKKKPKNLKLVYKFSVTPWIIACKYYLHSGCQTSLEAIALKKKIITYLPNLIFPTENFKFTTPYFKDEYKCLKFINQSRNKKRLYKISSKVNKVAINLNKKFNYESQFVKFLKKNYRNVLNSKLEKRKIIKENFFKILIFKFLSRVKSFLIRRDIYLKFIAEEYYVSKEIKEKKFKSISLKEMSYFLKRFNKSNRSNIKVKYLSTSTFLIYK